MKEKLQDWISANKCSDEMLWKKASEQQIFFIRDLTRLVGNDLTYEDYRDNTAFVIGTHTSKSISLPVYSLERPGLRFILRDNFYNWKLSVISDKAINTEFDELFHTTPPVEPDYTGNPLHPVYFEGFPKDLIFSYYAESDKKKWSAEITGDYRLWATIFLCMKNLGYVKPYRWRTRESHRKELDERTAQYKQQCKEKD